MPGGPSQRFARNEPVSVPPVGEHSELLERLERQAETLSETKGRLAMVEKALPAERAVRQQLSADLAAERAKVKRLTARVQQSVSTAETVADLEGDLKRERAGAQVLTHRLDEAWREIQALQARLDRRGLLGRRSNR